MGYVFPSEMFLVGSDLTPLAENFDAFLEGLTSWEPEMKTTGLVEPEMITVEGADYAEATAAVNNLFARNLWSDSLQIVPPTEALVSWILTGTERDPSEAIGKIWPRGGIATVRAVAVALAMAGGRPEYLPVLLAMTQILVDEKTNTQSWNATTNSIYPVFIVNGPIAKQIRLGSGYGMLGPDPVHPTGQVLGRAVRLILQDIGGATPGSGTMAIYGGMRTTNAVFAEDDEGVPEGWTTLAEDAGFTREQNVVSFNTCNGMMNVLWDFGGAEANLLSLNAMARTMATPNPNAYDGPIDPSQQTAKERAAGVVLVPRAFVADLAASNGFTKADVKQYLYDNSKLSYEDLVNCGIQHFIDRGAVYGPGDMCAPAATPEQIALVVAGGDQGGHGYWMAPAIFGLNSSLEIELPSNWDDLLYEAEIDLGALPSTR